MNKRRVEEYIPRAVKAIEVVGIANKEGKVPETFKGYISAFGASIIQSGLKATILFYGNENKDTKEERPLLPKAILYIINNGNVDGELYNYVENSKDKFIKSKIEDAAISLKLALRSFELYKSKEK